MKYTNTFNLSKIVLQRRLYSTTFNNSSSFAKPASAAVDKVFEPRVVKLPLFSAKNKDLNATRDEVDWTVSYSGVGQLDISAEQCEILSQPIDPVDIEIKQDSLLYLPEIKYRRILSLAFGPGKWALVPRSDHFMIGPKTVGRTYALIVNSKFVSEATGEQDFFKEADIITAFEGCKSNALMRCCKDLNIASELWDPVFISKYKASLKSRKPMVNPRNILRPIVAKELSPKSSVVQSIKIQTASKTFVPPKVETTPEKATVFKTNTTYNTSAPPIEFNSVQQINKSARVENKSSWKSNTIRKFN